MNKMEIHKAVNDTLNSAEQIKSVPVSPFFKEKAMNRMFTEQEAPKSVWSFWMPKLQVAALICFVVLNVMAFSNFEDTSYEDDVEEFAESFELYTSNDDSILNY